MAKVLDTQVRYGLLKDGKLLGYNPRQDTFVEDDGSPWLVPDFGIAETASKNRIWYGTPINEFVGQCKVAFVELNLGTVDGMA